ncbi:UNVERIFIED_ORG: putative spermidine/putrescine transport system permease protein [Burkholderia sp. 1263]|uniref:Spermidine/putrescine transport system permease protein n=2 Tax=Paraburkholderia terricola TaxID=169427 RepID=A0ABU1M025_9BURK|nr:ABC transporter permease [Paraburkholderia terricola]MDR6412357.1 putative spermidine/putrescine transport system permease protein [Paraburkholderia terricola]MDR6449935.1 putative spermidine/putrescine transport system permease protein [Paraburkholderia terricola]
MIMPSDFAVPANATEQVVIGDSKSLKAKLRSAERAERVKAMLLIFPLLAFLLITFLIPIGSLLMKSFRDSTITQELPHTAPLLRAWDPATGQLPSESVFAAFGQDLLAAKGSEGVSRVASRLNYDEAGMRSLIMKTARRIGESDSGTWHQRLSTIDSRWDDLSAWSTLKYASSPWTLSYYLKAFDFKRDSGGEIVHQPESERLYVDVFVRTAWVSISVSFLCLLFGYPVAYFLANIPARYSNLFMIMVLLPFWTSILVRTTAWVVVLQTNGVLNDLFIHLGLTNTGFALIYNRFGVLVAMTHILLPYAILSLYAVMKGVPNIYMKAARSLGAGPVLSFFQAYFPQTLPGVGAAGMLTFILAVGYYITPAIVGGADDQLASYYIANHVNSTLNWGLASALASILLGGVLLVYAIFVRMTGGAGVKLG